MVKTGSEKYDDFFLDLAYSSAMVCMDGYTSSCANEELGRGGGGGGEGHKGRMMTLPLDLAHFSSMVCMYGYTSSCAYEELGRGGWGGGRVSEKI